MRGREPEDITELNLDNCRATNIEGLSERFTGLQALSLINVGLTSLKGLPSLPALKRLELSDNRITNGLELLSTNCPSLEHLNLSNNKIKEVDALAPLAELKSLKTLDLFSCDLTQADDYREKVFKTIPSLKYLDGFDVNDDEAESDGEDSHGEHEDASDLDANSDDDDEVGLEYLEKSDILQDEDETEDFAPEDEESGDAQRGTKRKHDEEEEDEEGDDDDEDDD